MIREGEMGNDVKEFRDQKTEGSMSVEGGSDLLKKRWKKKRQGMQQQAGGTVD